MKKGGRFLLVLCLSIAIIIVIQGITKSQEDMVKIKIHSNGLGKNVSVDLLKYFPNAKAFYHSDVENVEILMDGGIATIVPRMGWVGDEIVTFFANKSLEGEIGRNLSLTNLEPIIEMSFPQTKSFAASLGQIEFSIIAFDPDNDALAVNWFVNGKLEKTEQAQGSIESHFFYNETTLGRKSRILKLQTPKENATTYVVNAIVNDSRASKVMEWHFSIVNQSCIDIWQCGNWSDCTEGKRYRDCRKINKECEFSVEKPPIEWVDPSCVQKLEKCKPNWTCSEWSNCKIDYDVQIVLGGAIKDAVVPKQERLCYDASYCTGSTGMELRDCNETLPIKTRKTAWCNASYVEIFNADTGQFISRIKELGMGETRLDIDLSLREVMGRDYCWYCYDGVRDYDETGIDCGGSCLECSEISVTYSLFDYIAFLSFLFADLLLIVFILFWTRERKRAKL